MAILHFCCCHPAKSRLSRPGSRCQSKRQKPHSTFLGLWCLALATAMPTLPIYGAVFKIGLIGPWTCDPFFAKTFPEQAAQLAVERIKKDPSFHFAHQLNWTLLEEDCQTCIALSGFVGYEKCASAFIGHINPGYCDSASLLAKSWDKAVFSWTCVNYELDHLDPQPTFVRTLPSATSIILTVLKYFHWAHVGIISSKEDLWMVTANKLANALRNQGIPVGVVTSIGSGEGGAEGTWAKIQAAGNIKGKQVKKMLEKVRERELRTGARSRRAMDATQPHCTASISLPLPTFAKLK